MKTEVLFVPTLDLNNTNVDMMTIAIRMNGVMIIQIPTLAFTIIESGKNSSINLKKHKKNV